MKLRKRVVYGDLEANGLLHQATQVWCGVFKDKDSGKLTKFTPDGVQDMLLWLDTVDVLIIHNGIGYDLPLLKRLYGYEFKGKVVDTLIMSRVQDENRRLPFNCPTVKPNGKRVGPHSIEAWGYRVGRGKVEHEDWDVFTPEMLHRCTEDVEILQLTYEALMAEGEGFSWRDAHMLSFKLFEILHLQEEYGWLVDRDYMDKCCRLLNHWMRKIDAIVEPLLPYIIKPDETKKEGEYNFVRKPFLASGDYNQNVVRWMADKGMNPVERPISGPFSRLEVRRVNIGSPAEVKDYLLSVGWIPEAWNYNDDGERTSPIINVDEPFTGVQSRAGKYIAKRLQIRHRLSNIEGWIRRIRPDGRIGSRVSGLASTGRAKHADIANVPGAEAFFGKQMRKCFIVKPGFKLVGIDSAGCQNRMLAARVKDPFFTETLINGTKEAKTSIHYVNLRAIKAIAGYDVTYGQAKSLNYAFMFGASDAKLGLMIGKDVNAGKKLREALLSVSAGFEALVKALTAEWRGNAKQKKKTINTRFGKKQVVEYYDGWVTGLDGRPIKIAKEHTILVYVLQSDEAIMMAGAYCLLYKRAIKRGWKWGVDWAYVCWYHDEFQCEVREDLAEEFARLAEQCIVDAGEFYKIECPHEGDSAIGCNWYETH